MAHSETSHRDALAESFSRHAREPDGFHLSFHEIHLPKPERNFFGVPHRASQHGLQLHAHYPMRLDI